MAIREKAAGNPEKEKFRTEIPPGETQTLDPTKFNIDGSGLGQKPFVWQKCKDCGKVTAVIKETEKCHDCTNKK
jgi:hypothetical protein